MEDPLPESFRSALDEVKTLRKALDEGPAVWSAGYADGTRDAEEDASKIMEEVTKILSNEGVKPGYRVTKALQALEAWHSTR